MTTPKDGPAAQPGVTAEQVDKAINAALRASSYASINREAMRAAIEAAAPLASAQQGGEVTGGAILDDEGLLYAANFVAGGIMCHLETGTPVELGDLEKWKAELMAPIQALFNRGIQDRLRLAQATLPVAASPEDTAEQFIQAAVDRAPEPLRRLGEWLANKLDDDDWKTAERMLLGATLCQPTPPVAGAPLPNHRPLLSQIDMLLHEPAPENALKAHALVHELAILLDEVRATTIYAALQEERRRSAELRNKLRAALAHPQAGGQPAVSPSLPAPGGWEPISTAPAWVNPYQALVGQINSEGRWVEANFWDAAWSRNSVQDRGATHWMPLPPVTAVTEVGPDAARGA